MRRSASPSKSQGVRLPPRSRGDKSTAVLKAAFRPLSGLPQRPSQPNPSSTSSPIKPVLAPLAPRSIEELQTEITEAELVLSARLETHNAARAAKGLPPHEAEQIVEQYIKLLTQYNHVKDATQLVFDKIAELQQLPSGDIHARYGACDELTTSNPA
ncbi:uncharacterized protein PAN0_001d0081 [Moesziomyces antarcticus]|uniref:Uncharacterized protein n=1 Tax=Pseudozyma antarctica TaxID=84753 RepID=A0A5C3FFC8_PSEA2|nr:uncharacterized protein PAN0_001d0081 [Moesziomyces antarcticus]GAK61886.1 conserved hypothetical protein [Moesziomyces antarcticus]SPO42407.1 uncharacterized protein PSANT_00090 [Moesziomyces antarcticus]